MATLLWSAQAQHYLLQAQPAWGEEMITAAAGTEPEASSPVNIHAAISKYGQRPWSKLYEP